MTDSVNVEFDKGIFCLSFDFELAWGMYDIGDIETLEQKARLTRERVLPRLFELLTKYQISATWAVVGHLFLDSCDGDHGTPSPNHSWFPDWFSVDPALNENEKPEWYAQSIIKKLVDLKPSQDIGLHGFSHCIWNDPGCGKNTARKEMENSLMAMNAMNLNPVSFVYPRNMVDHVDVLAESGIRIFRDDNIAWYSGFPVKLKKVFHILSQYAGITPQTTEPFHSNGIIGLPSTYMYISMDGFRRTIPVASRVKAAKSGINRAIREKKIFHMFTHPINFAYDDSRTDMMLNGMETIFEYACDLRKKNRLDLLNMSQICDLVERN